MARFTVRVELLDGRNGQSTDSLNRAMQAQGFNRLIRVQGGRRYHLPTAEYRMVGKYTRSQVCRLAKAALADIVGEAAILVTQGPCTWLHLRGVPQ